MATSLLLLPCYWPEAENLPCTTASGVLGLREVKIYRRNSGDVFLRASNRMKISMSLRAQRSNLPPVGLRLLRRCAPRNDIPGLILLEALNSASSGARVRGGGALPLGRNLDAVAVPWVVARKVVKYFAFYGTYSGPQASYEEQGLGGWTAAAAGPPGPGTLSCGLWRRGAVAITPTEEEFHAFLRVVRAKQSQLREQFQV
jgi:hypothetical protein